MKKDEIEELSKRTLAALLKLQQPEGSFKDPIYNLARPRAAAEIAKSALHFGKKKEAEKALNWLLKIQGENGSWKEVLPQLNEESSVATSIVGRIMLLAYKKTRKKAYLKSALKAGENILSKEFSPGYFIKSYSHYADVLNVNVNCSALMAGLFDETGNEKYRKARDRAVFNNARWQFKSGAFPYAFPLKTFPYEQHYYVQDPHYHAITLYYLLLSDPKLENRYAKISAEKAISWLESTVKEKGVDWSKADLTFSLGFTGVYGYSACCFGFFGKETAEQICIEKLKELELKDGGFPNHDPSSILETFKGVCRELFNWDWKRQNGYSLPLRIHNVRERLKADFYLRKKRDFSLYYSAQILDCLTELLELRKK